MPMHTDKHMQRERATDPLDLRALPWQEPDQDGWPAIRAALEARPDQRTPWRGPLTWLAAAASVVLAVTLVLRQAEAPAPGIEAQPEPAAQLAATEPETVDTLIAMSQTLEQQVRGMREHTVSMPADSAVYVAELEDLVAQVDQQLSYAPDSLNLWSQRINLLLDLAQMYQHQWERDYGLMASL